MGSMRLVGCIGLTGLMVSVLGAMRLSLGLLGCFFWVFGLAFVQVFYV